MSNNNNNNSKKYVTPPTKGNYKVVREGKVNPARLFGNSSQATPGTVTDMHEFQTPEPSQEPSQLSQGSNNNNSKNNSRINSSLLLSLSPERNHVSKMPASAKSPNIYASSRDVFDIYNKKY